MFEDWVCTRHFSINGSSKPNGGAYKKCRVQTLNCKVERCRRRLGEGNPMVGLLLEVKISWLAHTNRHFLEKIGIYWKLVSIEKHMSKLRQVELWSRRLEKAKSCRSWRTWASLGFRNYTWLLSEAQSSCPSKILKTPKINKKEFQSLFSIYVLVACWKKNKHTKDRRAENHMDRWTTKA